MRKPISLLISLILLLFLNATPSSATPKVFVNGQGVRFDVLPIVKNDVTLVPLRAIFQALGAQVNWDGTTQTIFAIKNGISVKLSIGEKIAYKDGKPVTLQEPARVIGGSTLVPLRFVSEAIGAGVAWDGTNQVVTITSGDSGSQSNTPVGTIKVHFLDVGQADSILVQFPNGQNMLVDAGNNDDGPAVVSYLKQQGIKKIDFLIGTHPHEDHIGGMDNVIQSFESGQVFMPRVTTTTKTFEDVLTALKAKGLKIITAKAGVTVFDQGNLKVNFVAPVGSSYDDLNNWSAVTRIQYGNIPFLLTGDAEAQSEGEMLNSGANLKADVLKVGHHGSSSSTSPAFLKAVAPKYAVISVGAGNDYGHPDKGTLAKLANAGVQVYRTDQDGTMVFTSNGNNITVEKLRSTVKPRAPDTNTVITPTAPIIPVAGGYIGNKNTKKFHLPSCSSLPSEGNRVYFKTRDDAIKAGYVPCKICNP
ncbi:stalk domain-containing protein [Desulfotomaculum copahuensis]|uniref:stalk domain-containing protein n=1 Tax=Desulfotomaculum copahuensis TaxID=1838280 RepID=UPI00098FD72C|nr:stalk domain-containing protein [Desulfotomaculum copahuensis]